MTWREESQPRCNETSPEMQPVTHIRSSLVDCSAFTVPPVLGLLVRSPIYPHVDNNIAARDWHWRWRSHGPKRNWATRELVPPNLQGRVDHIQIADKVVCAQYI